jgi:NAD(P)-dependent dehydrogenase (short-subunit alcohol dehydrogenase family)
MLPAPIRRAVDLALEATVVPSFTRLGPRARRALDGWEDLAPDALAGRVVVVTGATSGLGAAIARGVGAAGAEVVVVGRDAGRGAQVCAAVEAAGGRARFAAADLAELDQVRALAEDLRSLDALHAVVHNAGALLADRRESSDGIEVTWASMVVGPHLLTRMLADRTDRAIWMSSGGMYLQALDLDDWSWSRRRWDGTRAYAQAKRAQVDLVAEATARGEAPFQVALHPGWADTPGVADSLPGFHRALGPLLRSPEEGADTAVWLGAAPSEALTPGAFYLDRRPRGTVRWPGTATSPDDRVRLRRLVDQQAGLAIR